MDNSWVLDASKLQQENLDFVIVTVAKTQGLSIVFSLSIF